MNQLAAGNTDFRPIAPDQSLLSEFFSEFLDEAAFEDLACSVSGLRSISSCIAAIRTDEVVSALAEMLEA